MSDPAAHSPQPGDPAYHPAVRALARALRRRCGVRKGDRLVVAVSGGRDSVALLRGLAHLAPRRRWRLSLVVAHVQHHLRESAEGDAAFVGELARRLSLPMQRVDVDVRGEAEAGDAGGEHNLEATARRLRYAALARLAESHGARFVVTGHQAEDQLETVLMRLARGASLRGLSGMAWRRRLDHGDVYGSKHRPPHLAPRPLGPLAPPARTPPADVWLIRPLLGVTRAELAGYLDALGQGWREDPTNADVSRARARLRRDVLPVLAELYPDAARKATAAADHARAGRRALDRETDRAWAAAVLETDPHTLGLDRAVLRDLPGEVRRAVLRRALVDRGVPADGLSRSAVAGLARAAADRTGGQRVFTFARGAQARVTREAVTVGDMDCV